MLYLVTTPIGNLADLSFRAVEVLKSVDYILCEDTRHSRRLLSHYEISTPLKSCHKFNERLRMEGVLKDLERGVSIALISDAGVPAFADPGERLIHACREKGIEITAVGGGSACMTALILSGFSTFPFQFLGFLPRKKGKVKNLLAAANYPGVTIFYESPHRIEKTLQACQEQIPLCQIAVARELTKVYEEVVRGTAEELLVRHRERVFKGEIVLLIEGITRSVAKNTQSLDIDSRF